MKLNALECSSVCFIYLEINFAEIPVFKTNVGSVNKLRGCGSD